MATVAGKKVGPTGFGLMGMTWRPQQTPDDQAFAAMDKAIALGATFWSSGEFYGYPEPTLNLQLIQRYFAANPQNADKVVLCVKGAADLTTMMPTGSAKAVQASVDNCNRVLAGAKKIDVFSCARVDSSVQLEETIGALADYVKAGKIGAIGLSECSAATIEKAASIHPIASVEVEFSLWSTEIMSNGVAMACKKHNIPIIAYSPLGRGFLTGQIKSPADIPQGDIRHYFDRFQPENFKKNLDLVEQIKKVAQKKDVTNAQLALAWVKAHSSTSKMPIIIPIPGATLDSRVTENCQAITLEPSEKAELDKIISSIEIKGGRYNQMLEPSLWG
ncbi:MAG: Pyridoxine 4-dehydrogenase [Caeruleum heppii]|nr:MAG: Pyridoxine 4-dehydrogenase [Caeruleum heppii]